MSQGSSLQLCDLSSPSTRRCPLETGLTVLGLCFLHAVRFRPYLQCILQTESQIQLLSHTYN